MRYTRLMGMLLCAAVLLMIPFIGMQVSAAIQWSGFDFLAMGVLLLGTVYILELLFRVVKTKSWRWIIGGVVLLVFLIVWAELAVGIFGTPFAGS